MKYLVFDFETTGVGNDAKNQYKPYDRDLMPLPRENYPVELAAQLIDDGGRCLHKLHFLIKGARRLDPWVLQNCPHLSVARCDAEGIDFMEALRRMAAVIDGECTLVAHNMQYDWFEVIVRTVHELNEETSPAYRKLERCQRYCTCVNPSTKGDRSAFFFKKIGKWIGPKLSSLAQKNGVAYDPAAAHDAAYDVEITVQCLRSMLVRCEL